MRCRGRGLRGRAGVIEVAIERGADRVTVRVGRELRSPNRWRTWRAEYDESQQWEAAFKGGTRGCPATVLFPWPMGRRLVTIARLVPGRRNLLKDRDNRHFLGKPLVDAIKRLGWIKDDNERWLDQLPPTQDVSEDGRYWTVLTIEPAKES